MEQEAECRSNIRRCERRKNNVHYLDFIHGRTCRFMNFRKTVGISTTDICVDYNLGVDSASHKLFECQTFYGVLIEFLLILLVMPIMKRIGHFFFRY